MSNPNAPESAPRPSLHEEPDGHGSPSAAFHAATARLAELKDYASYYLSAKLDSYTSAAKRAVLWAVVGLLAGIAGLAILATAAVLLVVGCAQGISALLGNNAWAGNLIVGGVLLLAILATAFLFVRRLLGQSREATRKKYESLKRQQFAKYGHDVHERAKEAQSA